MSILKKQQIVLPLESKLAQGYSNAEFIGLSVMPPVLVSKRYGQYATFGKEGRKTYDTARGIGGKVKSINFEHSLAEYAIKKTRHLAAPIDDEEDEATVGISQLNLITQSRLIIQESLALEIEQEIANIVTNASNHTSSQTASANWTTASTDILGDIESAKEKIRAVIGRYPDTFVCSAKTFKAIKANTAILDRIKYTQKGVITEELIAELIGVKNIFVGRAVNSTTGSDVDVWGTSFAALLHVGETPGNTVLDPTRLQMNFGRTLTLVGYPKVKMYRDETINSTMVKVELAQEPKHMGADAGCIFTGTLGA